MCKQAKGMINSNSGRPYQTHQTAAVTGAHAYRVYNGMTYNW